MSDQKSPNMKQRLEAMLERKPDLTFEEARVEINGLTNHYFGKIKREFDEKKDDKPAVAAKGNGHQPAPEVITEPAASKQEAPALSIPVLSQPVQEPTPPPAKAESNGQPPTPTYGLDDIIATRALVERIGKDNLHKLVDAF
jgi:hypothetical protein